MNPVMYDKNITGDDPYYWVFSEISSDKWVNMTVIVPGKDGELPKTFGHYHTTPVKETYKLIHGEGVLLLQKKSEKDGKWDKNRVEEVYWVLFKPGDELIITPEWGHSWSNLGNTPLVTFDDWDHGHSPDDYKPIEELEGMCFYLVRNGEDIKSIPNKNYIDLPEPKWITAKEFNELNKLRD
jgi:oxalate decarboxylase/phosphoglucose isomerase-like protein (cupin superfamily)